jgi:hypothetical protein
MSRAENRALASHRWCASRQADRVNLNTEGFMHLIRLIIGRCTSVLVLATMVGCEGDRSGPTDLDTPTLPRPMLTSPDLPSHSPDVERPEAGIGPASSEAPSATASTLVILDFEDFPGPARSEIGDYYAEQGVSFSGASILREGEGLNPIPLL